MLKEVFEPLLQRVFFEVDGIAASLYTPRMSAEQALRYFARFKPLWEEAARARWALGYTTNGEVML